MPKQLSLNLFDSQSNNLEDEPELVKLPSEMKLPDGNLIIYKNLFDRAQSDGFFEQLLDDISWRQDQIKMFGKKVNLPRLTAWYGDKGKSYKYSGIKMNPDTWTPTLLVIKEKVETVAELNFNSVLVNLYRNGQDYVSWHSDDEPELGNNPTIASVSFGATRRFILRHKSDRDLDKVEVALTHGSLILMQGTTQHFWQHQVPKTAKKISPRVNLTFRVVK